MSVIILISRFFSGIMQIWLKILSMQLLPAIFTWRIKVLPKQGKYNPFVLACKQNVYKLLWQLCQNCCYKIIIIITVIIIAQ